ncbi:hypothetical protein [Nocardiopsis composta]|uniref:Putative pyridoxine 5'-phosphate oxidase superfamily flavin-nucleotide-binding protein n=1 Tax=Nocardiopsis composta TaxID=157465 RepID=A0A7W8QIV0_9ACTN|nr:hypothetical protein [Nocardiopsis composta]MBB5430530.1 putative pyridoxine 5'-phosphate oxidase superfamily flavin-nucleotide-binding protein [Nocardiopsis composta]
MTADAPGPTEITSEAELRELLGEPVQRALDKERSALADVDREWLAAAPFCLVATSDAAGNRDVSPKGDPAGKLALVLDDTTIAVPSRPRIAKQLESPDVPLEALEEYYGPAYTARLY